MLDKIPTESVSRWQTAGAIVIALSYDDFDGLVKAFESAEAVSFVSTWLIGERHRSQHKNVIETAKKAGVKTKRLHVILRCAAHIRSACPTAGPPFYRAAHLR